MRSRKKKNERAKKIEKNEVDTKREEQKKEMEKNEENKKKKGGTE